MSTFTKWSIDDILQRRKDAARLQGEWREEAAEDFKYRDGDQWNDEDQASLEEQGRPVVTFNRIGPIVNSVKGNEMNNRQEVRYIPRTMDDTGVNDTLNAAASYVRDGCDAEDEESDSFEDAATCGLGWTETYVDYEEDPNGKIIEERVPPLQMRWDPSSKKRNLRDSLWRSREKWMDVSEVKERWPDAELDSSAEPLETVDMMEHDATEAWKYENDQITKFFDKERDRVLVIHFQYKVREAYYRVGDPQTGRIIELPVERYNKLKDKLNALGATAVKQHRWKYKQKFLVGREVLEEGDAPVNDWSFNCITANREESTNQWFGIVRAMKDPQQWANKFFAQIMHIFNTNPKGGLIYEESAIDDDLDIEDKWADSTGVIKVNDGALSAGKIKERNMSNYPSSLDKMLQFAISSIRDVSGMNVEMLGMADREQSGVLEQERKKAALTILAPLA